MQSEKVLVVGFDGRKLMRLCNSLHVFWRRLLSFGWTEPAATTIITAPTSAPLELLGSARRGAQETLLCQKKVYSRFLAASFADERGWSRYLSVLLYPRSWAWKPILVMIRAAMPTPAAPNQ